MDKQGQFAVRFYAFCFLSLFSFGVGTAGAAFLTFFGGGAGASSSSSSSSSDPCSDVSSLPLPESSDESELGVAATAGTALATAAALGGDLATFFYDFQVNTAILVDVINIQTYRSRCSRGNGGGSSIVGGVIDGLLCCVCLFRTSILLAVYLCHD